MMGCVLIDAVVTPAPVTRECRYWHQLDMGEAEVDQVRQALQRALESTGRGEGPDMEFVDNRRRQRWWIPVCIVPAERAVIDQPRRSMNAAGLPLGAWVR